MPNFKDIEKQMEEQGWVLEGESPLAIRHTQSGNFARGAAAQAVINSISEGCPLQVFQNNDEPPPPMSGWPMNVGLFERYIDQEVVVTFLALVPLETLVRGGIDELNEYCQQAFADFAEMGGTEFRAVPHLNSSDGWSERLDGDVAIQVTCTLSSF